ncbi:nucleoside hydrolase [Bifidobacterium sp. MA2]|uniref:Nucleoside hydrolase n=1 Tax=Bifidobacterium santillanense TaxID=2809028 RepID=A0ABS5UPD8_9BIFI|nr:nucleoside hydrolase [Bifidobacterium santillanense]MBT1172792.1 nucleoside hydrolase [Bifidobacterium santillanense]
MNAHSLVRVIACVDTGVDDAMALAYLLASPRECELAGVLAGYGNVDADTAYANTRLVLDLFGRGDIPVFRSSTHPSWADTFIPDAGCAQFHGVDGLGGLRGRLESTVGGTTANAHERGRHETAADTSETAGGNASIANPTNAPDGCGRIPIVSVGGYRTDDPHANPAVPIGDPTPRGSSASRARRLPPSLENSGRPFPDAAMQPRSSRDGIDFLVDEVRAHGRDVTVLATGPLTDVDAAITRAPDIAPRLRLVMMGGTFTQPGNCWDAVAETNVIQDPEAADRVFHSGADVTMVGLDVTHQCLLPRSAAERWRATDTEAGRFLAGITEFSIAANLEADPAIFAGGMPLHDPLAAAVALDPSLVTCLDVAMRAETATGDFTGVRGRTTGDPVGLVTPDAPRAHVALGVDAPRFVRGFTDRLTALCDIA